MNFELKEFTNIPNCYHSFNVVNDSQFESTCENLIKEMSFFFKQASFEELKILNPNPSGNFPQYLSSDNIIYLTVKDGIRESQIIYQLAHELCHYFIKKGIKNDELKYFEESLCELSSHFFLRNKTTYYLNSRFRNLVEYAPVLSDYSSDALASATEFELSFSTSYDRYDRNNNKHIVKLILPIFEKTPSLWSEVPKLADIEASTIGKLLDLWKNKATAEHKKAIQEIQNIFK
ncbi:hypothetical protein [Lactococcus lactis]|uniref:hypothetical protein n=1 Tax=Lactococcus lactis TaxID=1358 RepID=UPI00071DBB4E|nr:MULTISPECIES: hypothetical protein [Lactococcus]ARE01471.1 prophage protein [Lactococcus lactis subsp. lactis]ARE03818.1 prophage protein [Lactococcus lactis subsp. lactis]KSU25328.1 hypothetical protein ML8_1982 [Lactococcus lactis subsp. lactis]MCT3112070.1 hypothetical protein [Lactococcus lactis]MDM7501752.1 hypothetical protein [Lactococcus lactis]